MNGKKKRPLKPYSTNVLDYPCTLSGFERESLAAEARLNAERPGSTPNGKNRSRQNPLFTIDQSSGWR
jgi:hypothetical protein